jgi:hypothetical protein
MRRVIWVGIAVLLLGLITASCGGSSPAATPTPEIHTVNGTFDLIAHFPGVDCGDACFTGYEDVTSGAEVNVSDENGTILGTVEMGSCKARFV